MTTVVEAEDVTVTPVLVNDNQKYVITFANVHERLHVVVSDALLRKLHERLDALLGEDSRPVFEDLNFRRNRF